MMNIINIGINHIISIFDKSWNFSKKSYSQEGEDVLLTNYLNSKKSGFYVDVGAYHPFRFSNTYMFYKKGWRGINIDATPGSMALFNKDRPRDINLEVAISNRKQKIDYFVFDEPALNSFSGRLSKQRDRQTKYKIKKTVTLKTKKLSEVLDKYVPQNTNIDFMSVDVEGYEYQVLTSNNWERYHPKYLLVEVLETELEGIQRNMVHKYLKKQNYSIIGFTGRTVVYKSNK